MDNLRAFGAHSTREHAPVPTWSEGPVLLQTIQGARQNKEKNVGRALCACTTLRPVATSRRMYSTSDTCGPKQIGGYGACRRGGCIPGRGG
jgi:hypothetical protein